MPRSAIEVVEAYFDAWNRRDLDGLSEVLDADVEWRRSADFPEGRMLRGRDALIDFAGSMFEVFANTPIRLDECTESVPGRVIVVGTTRFEGERSGVATSSSWVRLYLVEGDRIVGIRAFASREEAAGAV
jgi:ketosteroid isomerase-like protein